MKEMFLNHLYGGMDEPEQKIIDVFICKLRKKLANASGGKDYIETVWGRGYALRDPSDDDTPIAVAGLSRGIFLALLGFGGSRAGGRSFRVTPRRASRAQVAVRPKLAPRRG